MQTDMQTKQEGLIWLRPAIRAHKNSKFTQNVWPVTVGPTWMGVLHLSGWTWKTTQCLVREYTNAYLVGRYVHWGWDLWVIELLFGPLGWGATVHTSLPAYQPHDLLSCGHSAQTRKQRDHNNCFHWLYLLYLNFFSGRMRPSETCSGWPLVPRKVGELCKKSPIFCSLPSLPLRRLDWDPWELLLPGAGDCRTKWHPCYTQWH